MATSTIKSSVITNRGLPAGTSLNNVPTGIFGIYSCDNWQSSPISDAGNGTAIVVPRNTQNNLTQFYIATNSETAPVIAVRSKLSNGTFTSWKKITLA